ncbi:MAG: hypothetical protein CMG74_13140 [Candidatus Marinimicrobia bacterium]|nr:hypothetical protein [Candidatus Neomarinimicrobiota bacterium]|tara:strand:+ start:55778 stop:56845 length:1068 start_codon:yes stop_codon:yes gene_type:complete
MKVKINNNAIYLPDDFTLDQLIDKLGIKFKRPIITINEKKINGNFSFELEDCDNIDITLLGKREVTLESHGLLKYIYIKVRKIFRISFHLKIIWLKILSNLKPNITMEFKGEKISFYCPDRKLRSRAKGFIAKEPETIDWVNNFKEDEVLWDIGANIGIVSLYSATLGATVFSFEPLLENYSFLCENIKINKFSNIITPFNIALSDKTKLDYLYINSESLGASGNTFGEATNQNGEQLDTIYKRPLIGYMIDDFIKKFDVPVPNHIKLDVDGIEYEILHGAVNTLANPKVKSVLVEISILKMSVRDKIIDLLKNNGFKLKSIAGLSVPNDQELSEKVGFCHNYIFERINENASFI